MKGRFAFLREWGSSKEEIWNISQDGVLISRSDLFVGYFFFLNPENESKLSNVPFQFYGEMTQGKDVRNIDDVAYY